MLKDTKLGKHSQVFRIYLIEFNALLISCMLVRMQTMALTQQQWQRRCRLDIKDKEIQGM